MRSSNHQEDQSNGASPSKEPQVKLEGQEMPFSDGSAMFWADMIKQVTIRDAPSRSGEQAPPKSFYEPQKVSITALNADLDLVRLIET